MKRLLCVPCANGMRAEGKTVKMLPGKTVKITCECCGRRRFGVAYDVASEPSRTARKALSVSSADSSPRGRAKGAEGKKKG